MICAFRWYPEVATYGRGLDNWLLHGGRWLGAVAAIVAWRRPSFLLFAVASGMWARRTDEHLTGFPQADVDEAPIAILEAGANWISAWLDRLDHKFEVIRATTYLTLRPSDYFRRQCLVSADPDESLTATVVAHIGADYFIWASDYPHIDASMNVVDTIRRRLAPLSRADQRKVLGSNAQRFYGLAL